MDIAEAYHPDRVLRQFGLVQGVPEPPIEPVYILREDELRAYGVTHSAEQLDRWDADPRPLIELQGPQAQHGWDFSDDYLEFLDRASHVLVDPRSIRRDPPIPMTRGVDALAVSLFIDTIFLYSVLCCTLLILYTIFAAPQLSCRCGSHD